MQEDQVTNKIAIITGAAGNLGKAVAKKFIDGDYFVAATIVHHSVSKYFPADKFEEAGVDLNNESATQNFVENIISKYQKIDVAVLTAGGFEMGKMADTKIKDIERQYKLNFETVYNAAQPIFIQMLKQDSGKIFLIGSKAGLNAKDSKGMIAYGLSKALIFRLAELMNEEAKGKNVIVNVVVPAIIDTPENREAMPGADFNKWTKPEDIADIIYWYCSQEAASLRENIIKVYSLA